MRHKRARARDEVSREINAQMPDATDSLKEAELQKRTLALQVRGLLIETWNLDDLEADLQWCGLTGSPTKVHRIQSIVLTKEGYTEIPPNEEGVRRMVHELIVDHTLG
jgi:electron transfer flavoprotein beta subunit